MGGLMGGLMEHHLVMNTPGERDGIFQGWFDGRQALGMHMVRFRDVDTLGIYFSTFFGGSDSGWGPLRTSTSTTTNFADSTQPLSEGLRLQS